MKKKQNEETEKLSKEVSGLIKEEGIRKRWDTINRNQQLIYDKLTSTEGTAKEHVELVRGLLGDYVELFQRKIMIVDSLFKNETQITHELKLKIKRYDKLLVTMKKAIKETQKERGFYNEQITHLNNQIERYNVLVSELNEKLLEL